MRVSRLITVGVLACSIHAQGQSSPPVTGTGAQPSSPSTVARIGPGVTPPRLKFKVEPTYTPEAQSEHVQGTVVLEIVVNEQGLPRNIKVVSPLGFGLDERAEQAVGEWRFVPGEKDGHPASIQAAIEVNFRLLGLSFDEKLEKKRTRFNEALAGLNRPDPVRQTKAVESIERLAREKFPSAMFVLGIWKIRGEKVAADPAGGLALIEQAADKDYGPALYQVAIRLIRGQDLPSDSQRGLKMMQEAALLGSGDAQFYLGAVYRDGKGVPQDVERAKRYFRLCAVKGVVQCQYRLANLLFDDQNRSESDLLQAVAWYRLAGDQRLAEAREIADREQPKLTTAQAGTVNSWMARFSHK